MERMNQKAEVRIQEPEVRNFLNSTFLPVPTFAASCLRERTDTLLKLCVRRGGQEIKFQVPKPKFPKIQMPVSREARQERQGSTGSLTTDITDGTDEPEGRSKNTEPWLLRKPLKTRKLFE